MADRRDFMGMALGAFTGLGALGALYAAKRTWDPLPSVKAAGFTTLDLSNVPENTLITEKWRGKPIFILKQSKKMLEFAKKKNEMNRLIKVGNDYYAITVGLCTHLGCIPAYNADDSSFLCACHGATYDSTANVTRAPAPRGLDIPPFKLDGNKVVLGETGPEYKKLLADGVTLPV
jgi:ubiquinol-cytochrome c reductase iron-sulfur subunit